MLASILDDFREQPGGGTWALSHMDQHRSITTKLQKNYSIIIPLFPLDQMPENNMANWLRVHQEMHDTMAQYIGVGSGNLSDLDLKNNFSVKLWLRQHFLIHQAAAQILGILR